MLEERCTERDSSYDSPMKFEAPGSRSSGTWVFGFSPRVSRWGVAGLRTEALESSKEDLVSFGSVASVLNGLTSTGQDKGVAVHWEDGNTNVNSF